MSLAPPNPAKRRKSKGKAKPPPAVPVGFPTNLASALSARKLSRLDLARKIETSPTSLHEWLHGKGFPRIPTFIRLARALGTTIDRLLKGESA